MINQLKKKFNITKDIDEKVYLRIGSTWFYDGFYLYLVLPWCILNFFLNVFTFVTLRQIKVTKNTKNLYIYLKVYVICCAIMSLGGSTMFISFSPRYVPFGISYFARLLRCQINLFIFILFHFYAYILDIFIIFERLSQFSWRSKSSLISKYSPYTICLMGFIFCTIVNMPSSFWFNIETDDDFIKRASQDSKTFSYCSESDFLTSPFGSILSILMLSIKDILTLILEIYLDIKLFVYYRKFLKNKSSLKSKGYLIVKHGRERRKFSILEINLFLMTILLSFISILTHFSSAFTKIILFAYQFDTSLANLIIMITTLVSLFKYFSNFFILYIFNKKFKSVIVNLICLKRIVNNEIN